MKKLFWLLLVPLTVLAAPDVKVSGYTDMELATEHTNWLMDGIDMVPGWHHRKLRNFYLRYLTGRSRGLANDRKIILNTKRIDDRDELVSVFVHEMGHNFSMSVLEDVRLGNGMSIFGLYSSISWEKGKRKCVNCFVSGYGSTNKYESFAEEYALFRLNPQKFRYLARRNAELGLKYTFMKLLFGREYCVEDDDIEYSPVWDVTRLKITCFEL